jgi:hypothetical protein
MISGIISTGTSSTNVVLCHVRGFKVSIRDWRILHPRADHRNHHSYLMLRDSWQGRMFQCRLFVMPPFARSSDQLSSKDGNVTHLRLSEVSQWIAPRK